MLGERDSAFDVAVEERWMAPLRTAESKCSKVIRTGIAASLVLFSVFPEQASSVRDVALLAPDIVDELLGEGDEARWWSLSNQLQALAEAAPQAFLDALENGLLTEPSPVMALFQEDNGGFGHCYQSDLLWALEILAWEPRYLARVSYILAQLARRDPGGRYANRPDRSLYNIFRLWLPRTHATLEQRLVVIDYLRKIEPQVAWDVMMRIVPTGHDIAEQPTRPRWRDFSPEKEEAVTYGLIEKGVTELCIRLVGDAGKNADRWTKLVDCFANFPSEQRNGILRALSDAVKSISELETRRAIRKAIRRFLHNHRAYPDAVWRLPEDQLAGFENVYDSLAEDNCFDKFGWLFEAQTTDNPHPTGKGWSEDEKLVQELRADALREIIKIYGEGGLLEFAKLVEAPWFIGLSTPDAVQILSHLDGLLVRCLNSESEAEIRVARGIVAALFNREGKTWLSELLRRAATEHWNSSSILKICLTVQPQRLLWDWLPLFDADVERTYWAQMDPLWMEGTTDDKEFAAGKLIDVARARTAVHLVGRAPDGIATALLVRALREAAQESWPQDGGNEATMFMYSVEEILFRLDKATDINDEQVAEIEWMVLPLLEFSRRPPVVLHRKMARDPRFFVEVVRAVYKPDPDIGVVEEEPTDLERARRIATRAYQLLRTWKLVPGSSGEDINGQVLEKWVRQARLFCKDIGRLTIGEQQIGAVLAHAPSDADGVWPHMAVRDLIEISRSKNLEKGLITSVRKKRGMTSRGLTDGGAQERDLASLYRKCSRATELQWPRTSAVLEIIAKSYEFEGQRFDDDAEQVQW